MRISHVAIDIIIISYLTSASWNNFFVCFVLFFFVFAYAKLLQVNFVIVTLVNNLPILFSFLFKIKTTLTFLFIISFRKGTKCCEKMSPRIVFVIVSKQISIANKRKSTFQNMLNDSLILYYWLLFAFCCSFESVSFPKFILLKTQKTNERTYGSF